MNPEAVRAIDVANDLQGVLASNAGARRTAERHTRYNDQQNELGLFHNPTTTGGFGTPVDLALTETIGGTTYAIDAEDTDDPSRLEPLDATAPQTRQTDIMEGLRPQGDQQTVDLPDIDVAAGGLRRYMQLARLWASDRVNDTRLHWNTRRTEQEAYRHLRNARIFETKEFNRPGHLKQSNQPMLVDPDDARRSWRGRVVRQAMPGGADDVVLRPSRRAHRDEGKLDNAYRHRQNVYSNRANARQNGNAELVARNEAKAGRLGSTVRWRREVDPHTGKRTGPFLRNPVTGARTLDIDTPHPDGGTPRIHRIVNRPAERLEQLREQRERLHAVRWRNRSARDPAAVR